MTKSELKEQIRDAEIMIKKSKGSDEHHMDVVAVGSMEAIACSIGKALVDLANTSDQMLKSVYCMCKGIVAEIEDPDSTPDPEEVFEDEDSEGGLICEE